MARRINSKAREGIRDGVATTDKTPARDKRDDMSKYERKAHPRETVTFLGRGKIPVPKIKMCVAFTPEMGWKYRTDVPEVIEHLRSLNFKELPNIQEAGK